MLEPLCDKWRMEEEEEEEENDRTAPLSARGCRRACDGFSPPVLAAGLMIVVIILASSLDGYRLLRPAATPPGDELLYGCAALQSMR